MDLRTGKTYASLEEALAAGVPASDIAEVRPVSDDEAPIVVFTQGPFKGRAYRRQPNGQLVRVKL